MTQINGLNIPTTTVAEKPADKVIWSPKGFQPMTANKLAGWNNRLATVIATGKFNWSAISDYGGLTTAMEMKDKFNNQLRPALEAASADYPVCVEILDKLRYISANPGILRFEPGSGAERTFMPSIAKRLGGTTPQVNMRADKVVYTEEQFNHVAAQLEDIWS